MIVSRFAPSPTGRLHLGHAFSAWLAHGFARQRRGAFILRIEDIDPGRCRDEFVQGIREDLHWLGLDWDGPVRHQSQHLDDYAGALDQLKAQGLVYPCFCTRKAIAEEIVASGQAPHGPDGPIYPGTCRHLGGAERAARMAAEAHAWRLDMAAAVAAAGSLHWHDARAGKVVATPELFGDVVLARKDAPTSYHLAVVYDDALQNVSDVVRGEDLFAATHVHRLLQALLDLPTPCYHHHALIRDETGRRLAKRDRAATLAELRAAGVGPQQVIEDLAVRASDMGLRVPI